MITYLQAVSVIENFATQNEMVQKFGFEFKEQMPNIATEDERYPLLFVVPIGALPSTNANEFEIDIYCLDRYTQDRVNVTSVVSDTQLILAMLSKWLEEGQTDMDVIHAYPMLPINNDLLDYCGGWVMRVRVEVDMVSICEIPLSGVEPTPPTPCDDASYIVEYVNGTLIQQGTIPSGGSETIQVPNPATCDDATLNINGSLFTTIGSGDTYSLLVHNTLGDQYTVGAASGLHWQVGNSTILINGNQLTSLIAEGILQADLTASDGATFVGTIQNSTFITVADSVVSNSDDTYSVNVLAEQPLELPDTTYNVYVAGVLQASTSLPTLGNDNINIVWT